MEHIGKAVGTIAIWGGTAGLAYLFNSFHVLDGIGAGLMVFGAVIATCAIWKI